MMSGNGNNDLMWIDSLRAQIEHADMNGFEPSGEVPKDATMIGEVPFRLRKIWALGRAHMKNCERLNHEMKWSKDEISNQKMAAECAESKTIAEVLSAVFWLETRRHFKLFGPKYSTLELIEGWKLVTYKEEHPSSERLWALLDAIHRAA